MTTAHHKSSLQHLISIEDTDKSHLDAILATAKTLIADQHHRRAGDHHYADMTVANLFFESSTRTRCSFELAAKRLGATVINCPVDDLALQKGETFADTLTTLEAMDCHYFVIRHKSNTLAQELTGYLQPHSHIINAGAGYFAHPTQALLDLLTIQQAKPDAGPLKIAIVGDINHSRVVQSQLALFDRYQLGEIHLSGPQSCLPSDTRYDSVRITESVDDALADADVIIMLRIQLERMSPDEAPNTDDYLNRYGLTAQRLQNAKCDAIVMHPGPFNRNVEIESSLVDGVQSQILQQVNNGVALRMGLLKYLHDHQPTS